MNPRTPVLVALALFLSAGSLALGAPAPAPPAAPAAPDAPPAPPRPAFRLLEAGAAPLRPLRIIPAVGLKQDLRMRLQVAMELSLGGNPLPEQPMPAMIMSVGFEVREVRPNGDFAYAFKFGSAEVESGTAGVDPMLIEMYKASLGGLAGSSGTGVCTNRGLVIETRMEIRTLDLMSKAVLESLRESLRDIVVPLPEEAVGAGAKWQQRTDLVVGGMALEQTTTYTLLEVTGSRISYSVEVKQVGKEQTFESPMIPGVPVKLLSFTSTSTGKGAMDLTKITPEALETTASLEANFEVEEDNSLVQKMTISTKVQPAK